MRSAPDSFVVKHSVPLRDSYRFTVSLRTLSDKEPYELTHVSGDVVLPCIPLDDLWQPENRRRIMFAPASETPVHRRAGLPIPIPRPMRARPIIIATIDAR